MDAPGSSPPPPQSGATPPPPGPTPPAARRATLRLGIAVAMILAGLIWIGQGLGILTAGRSFMIGDPTWAVIGFVVAVLGGLVAVREWRRGS